MNPMTANSIASYFQGLIYDPSRMDVQHTPIYDTVTFTAGSTITQTASTFFTNVGPASGKTVGQTNLTNPGRLSAPQAFSIFSFRLRWAENINPTDLFAIASTLALNFRMGTKDYQTAPLWYFGAGGGVNAFTTATNATYLTNGVPTRESILKLQIVIPIGNQTDFSAYFVGNNVTLTAAVSGGTGATFQLLLDGLYARGIQ